jgi:hypothetical protein
MFGIVVVPRDAVEFQKRKESFTVPLESFLVLERGLGSKITLSQFAVETINGMQVFSQKAGLQSKSIHCLNHEQARLLLGRSMVLDHNLELPARKVKK